MRFLAITLVLFVAATASAERQKLGTVNAETPEGQLLQQIGNEADDAKKLALLEDFAAKFPKHESTAWVYEQMIVSYSKGGQHDKAIATGDKLLAIDPDDVENAYICLQSAEKKKDADLVIKWSATTSACARKLAATPKPTEQSEVEDWEHRVDYAKQMDVRTEYSLFATLLQVPDAKKKVALGDALEQRSPASQYLPQMADARFRAYVQAGDNARALAFAEKVSEQSQNSPEILLAAADSFRGRKQYDKAVALAKRAAEVAQAKPKPEGADDADWQNWKTQFTGRAHWMAGVVNAAQNKWAAADQELRAALPGIKTNAAMNAEALFYLGVANYRLAEAGETKRAADALRFSEQCATLPGPFQVQARTNVKAIRSQYHIQ